MLSNKSWLSLYLYSLISFILFCGSAAAQNRYFTESEKIFGATGVAEIRIEIRPDYLAYILDPQNSDSDSLFSARFIFNNTEIGRDTVENVGFRLRGNTSRYSKKKSFKVDFNNFISGQDFYGLEKFNINGEHNDPSIMRAMISWQLFKNAGIPASRSNYAAFFINNSYKGLYVLVEHIDEEYIQARFDGPLGNLYKCLWPADLDNLGQNPDAYKFEPYGRPVYDLKTNKVANDYSDLANFINFINTTSGSQFTREIEEKFNVPYFLRFLALNTLLGMWDDYWFNKNNYYLYHNLHSDKFEFVPYDYDNTYGIDWSNIDWAARNIYAFGRMKNPEEPRLLVERILGVPAYKNLYSQFIDEFINGIFKKEEQDIYFQTWRNATELFVQIDPFYSLDYQYTFNNHWQNALTEAAGAHVKYGFYDYIDRRIATARSQLVFGNVPLQILDYSLSNDFPVAGEKVKLRSTISTNDIIRKVECVYFLNDGEREILELNLDADQSAAQPGTAIWSADLPTLNKNESLQFFLRAQGAAQAWTVFPENAPGDPIFVFSTDETVSFPVRINEFMAANDSTIRDESGEYDDWIELYNPADTYVDLSGMFLSDNPQNRVKWMLPDTILQPNDFLLIWADEDGQQGPTHANFKLSRDGEFIGLFAPTTVGNFVIDSLSFGPLDSDVSFGRSGDGAETWAYFLSPTPGESNVVTGITEAEDYNNDASPFQLTAPFPNPADSYFRLGFNSWKSEELKITVYNIRGKIELKSTFTNQAGKNEIRINCARWPVGIYFVAFEIAGQRAVKKVTVLR
ncbi:MAG: T9SS C-terminal target domain-containing protein [Calditrichaeota bacterium]|nr:MAG: T9SS C-terminal target domain-containing protein [Calditrichota bacterium]